MTAFLPEGASASATLGRMPPGMPVISAGGARGGEDVGAAEAVVGAGEGFVVLVVREAPRLVNGRARARRKAECVLVLLLPFDWALLGDGSVVVGPVRLGEGRGEEEGDELEDEAEAEMGLG